MTNSEQNNWLLDGEPAFYKKSSLGYDPYAIWVTRLHGLEVEKVPARLLAYTDPEHTKATVIYLDGTRDVVLSEQLTERRAPRDGK